MRRLIFPPVFMFLLLCAGQAEARRPVVRGGSGGVGSIVRSSSRRVRDITPEQLLVFFLFGGGVVLLALLATLLQDETTRARRLRERSPSSDGLAATEPEPVIVPAGTVVATNRSPAVRRTLDPGLGESSLHPTLAERAAG